jgi:hypothetical protein
MSLRGVVIKEGAVGPNVAGDSREFGLVCSGVAAAGAGSIPAVELDKVYALRSLAGAEAAGLSAGYDAAGSVNVHRHISEFYRRAGGGKKLHVILVAQPVAPADMVTAAKQLAVESGGGISDMAFAYSPPADYADTFVNGLAEATLSAIPALQAFAGWAEGKDMPLHTILEARLGDTVAALPDLRALPDLSADKVTLVCGQDWGYAEALAWAHGRRFADVGTFLGVVASQPWNRNPGEVLTQSLTEAARRIWIDGGLSNHKKYSEVYDLLEGMNAKGYVFPIRYQGIAGYFWNDGHCCCPVVMDASGSMNQHEIYFSHAISEGIRALRIAYLPEVKRPVALKEGKITDDMLAYFNALGDGVFARMDNNGLISGGKTTVDADSDLLFEKVLRVHFSVVPTGMVNEIVGTINLKNA